MEMLSPDLDLLSPESIRPIKRVEFERLVAEGCFADERVELLLGMVVEMSPSDPSHDAGVRAVFVYLLRAIGERARVESQASFAASDISEPVPDVFVVPNGRDVWREHGSAAHLVVEVSNTSVRKDRGVKARLYALADVDEYWLVDLQRGRVEIYRDRADGEWRTKTTHARGESISPRAFPDVVIPVSEIVPPVGS